MCIFTYCRLFFVLISFYCFYGVLCRLFVIFFFSNQKTAYEVRISDWSSDVCSSERIPHVTKRAFAIEATDVFAHRPPDRVICARNAVQRRSYSACQLPFYGIPVTLSNTDGRNGDCCINTAHTGQSGGNVVDRKHDVSGQRVSTRVERWGSRRK